jgi:uncharacterized membrane protein YeaQ/YmgE (transglycosylase-associated protein family)
MSIIGWIVFGLIVGIVVKLVTPGRDSGGRVLTAELSIVGAIVGGYLGRLLDWYHESDSVGFLLAAAGTILPLTLYRLEGRLSRA